MILKLVWFPQCAEADGNYGSLCVYRCVKQEFQDLLICVGLCYVCLYFLVLVRVCAQSVKPEEVSGNVREKGPVRCLPLESICRAFVQNLEPKSKASKNGMPIVMIDCNILQYV